MSDDNNDLLASGKTVSVHYVGTLEDGTEFDSSRARGETLTFELGSGQLIEGFDTAVKNMTVGETKNIKLAPNEAYGEENPELFKEIPKEEFPDDFEFSVGSIVHGTGPADTPVQATIAEVRNESDGGTVLLNFNHPMAGKTLNFEIELVDVTGND